MFKPSSIDTVLPKPQYEKKCEYCNGTGNPCDTCQGYCYDGSTKICVYAGIDKPVCEYCGGRINAIL